MQRAKIIDDTASSLTIKLKRSFCSQHGADWNEYRVKADYTLWNVMQGNIYIEVGDITYSASEGDVVIFHPGTEYRASTDADGCRFLYNRFSAETGHRNDIMAKLTRPGILPQKIIGKSCRKFCRDFTELLNSSSSAFKTYSLFISYLCDVSDTCKSADCVLFRTSPVKVSSNDPNIVRVIEYIDENFSENLSVPYLAKMAAMSEKHFISCFKKIAGLSPGQYVISCRMRCAAQLLLNSEKTVAEISKEVGYANPYTFSNTFKKYYEESPINFKNHFVY